MGKGNNSNQSEETPYQYAYRLASDALKDADLEERAEKSGALIERQESGNLLIKLSFLNRNCLIRFPEITISYQENGDEVPLWSKILILHYLGKSQGNPLTGEWINFRQLSGGDTYYPAFVKRSQKPLLDFFADRLDLLEEAAQALGGQKGSEGDRGVIIPALPRVPIALIFWSGDEEFQPEARILFDSTIPTYLATEDVAVLTQQTVFGLIKCAKSEL
jgi:hypothetical protein